MTQTILTRTIQTRAQAAPTRVSPLQYKLQRTQATKKSIPQCPADGCLPQMSFAQVKYPSTYL